jgi:hypothetical protein
MSWSGTKSWRTKHNNQSWSISRRFRVTFCDKLQICCHDAENVTLCDVQYIQNTEIFTVFCRLIENLWIITDRKREKCYMIFHNFVIQAGRSGDRISVGTRFSAPVQTGPGVHSASCTMGTGSFPGVECGRGVTLTPHPFLVRRSKNNVALYLYSP